MGVNTARTRMNQKQIESYLKQALLLSENGIQHGGGPFGAIVVKTHEGVVGEGFNRVVADNDPTAHAEMVAIREACKNLKTFNLRGCILFVNCMPCPMCLSAAYWAQIESIYYAATSEDASRIGFKDSHIYAELELPIVQRQLSINPVESLREQAVAQLQQWYNHPDRKDY